MSGKLKTTLAVAILLVLAGIYSAFSYVKAAAQAYVYGYPLVLVELTRQSQTASNPVTAFNHGRVFPDHTFRNVVRPNNDTLYSIAWLDLKDHPVVLSVPDTQGRYYVMPLMDAWTNVFATVGKRSHGTHAGEYLIVGPEWQGEIEQGKKLIRSPTDMVWIIGRIQTNGPEDIENVVSLQDQFLLTPLTSPASTRSPTSLSQRNTQSVEADIDGERSLVTEVHSDPAQTIEDMSGRAFFTLFSELLSSQSPSSADAEILATIASVGLVPGESFNTGPISSWLLDLAKHYTHEGITRQLAKQSSLENGWSVRRDLIGVYGTHYGVRTGVAMVGLGALPPEEAVYPNTKLDADGNLLTGVKSYRLHFPAGETPPADAFWSLTVYDEAGFLVSNPLGRYAIGDRDPLIYNPDGSLDLHIQHSAPETKDAQANWLPSPPGNFALTMRIYLPQPRFLQSRWQLPPVKPVD
ncbi:MAG: DUF1254 domain-containing protein [Halioglobus sp.]